MMTRANILVAGLALLGLSIAGCTETPTATTTQSPVSMEAMMQSSTVTSATLKGSVTTSGAACDSLKILRVRVLISALKLHRTEGNEKEDDETGDRPVKLGPMVLQVDATGLKVFATGTIPPGNYDKVKFEFHRISSGEVATYLNDTVFADFVTNERSTVIVDGLVYVNGTATPFVYKSDVTANLNLKLESMVTFTAGITSKIVFILDPLLMFRDHGWVLDPRDHGNHGKIDGCVHLGFKVLKRLAAD